MKVNKADLIQVENLIKALRKAKFDSLEGMEVLAMAQMFEWSGGLLKRIQEELRLEEQFKSEKKEEEIPPSNKKTTKGKAKKKTKKK